MKSALAVLALCSLAPSASADRISEMRVAVEKRLKDTFQVDARHVPIVILGNKAFNERFKKMAGSDPRLVSAFHVKGTVYVRKNMFRLSDRILAHELLHAMSIRFTNEAAEFGFRGVIEGTTDYLTHRMYPPVAFRQRGRLKSAYGHYENFARRIAELVGDPVITACYFEEGFFALEAAVDKKERAGTLRAAARLLEVGDVTGAENVLAAGGK
jgi:hypothetical protein